MLRASVLLRCVQKEISIAPSADVALLGKILSPTIQSSELASLAVDTAAAVQRLNVPRIAAVLELFSRHGVRHEQLMFTGFWRVFKTDLPLLSGQSNDGIMQNFAVCTATVLRLMLKEGFVHDQQLLAIALGRCVECAPYLSFRGVVDMYEGIRFFDRKYFSLTEVALYTGRSTEQGTQEFNKASSSVLSNQPNIVDVLCGELESRLRLGSFEDYEIDPSDVVRLLQSLAVLGLADVNTLSSIRKVVESLRISVEGILDMLVSVHGIHTRVMDVLDYDGDDELMQTERSAFVKVLIDSLVSIKIFSAFHRCDPQLVLRFRQLFEMYPTLAEEAPKLWDAVRVLRVAHKHTVDPKKLQQNRPVGGTLFKKEFTVKVKPIIADRSEAEKFVPPQFKTWRGPAVNNLRHKAPAAPKMMGFGTRRISKNYIKAKRRKFAPTVW